MCGIFGVIGNNKQNKEDIKKLASFAARRGRDSGGILFYKKEYKINKADLSIKELIKKIDYKDSELFLGIGRLITNDDNQNQPYSEGKLCIFHNGIVVNDNQIFKNENLKRKSKLDTEVFHALIEKYLETNNLSEIQNIILNRCSGTFSIAVALPEVGKLILCSNHGSLYYGKKIMYTFILQKSITCKL